MKAGPPTRSTVCVVAWGAPPARSRAHGLSPAAHRHPTRRAFPTMAIMMLLPVMVGAIAMLVNNMGGFIEAAFMDMTLTLENFDYKFGPGECGEWRECGNATFESYQRARDLAFVLFVVALVVVAFKDMIKGGLGGDVSLGAVDTKTLPAMLQYSVLVLVFLFIFPPIWDVASGIMNNIGIWILNPHYDLTREYVHGSELRGEMCGTDIKFDDLVGLAPYVRDADAWTIYQHGNGPLEETGGGEWIAAESYRAADNYIIDRDGVIPRECLNNINTCSAHGVTVNRPSQASNYQIGDILCNPDYKVKYVFRQALGVVEMDHINPEQVLGAVTGIGGDDIMVAIFTQFLKSSVTLQVIMVVFLTGVMVDVVTAFALAILPVVPFYRFLPMSDKVRLGDYSGAAFALLAMPLVASLVLVAGAGAVANMAADTGEDFASFFVWLAAIAVVLLVIAIPATMVPLIGSAQAQATAALQTGVQTAQFAATSIAAAGSGALRGRRESMEFNRLNRMGVGSRSPLQQARFDQLKAQGYDKMSTARAALTGGTAGLRGQMFDKEGRPTDAFRGVAMPGTQDLTRESVQGLGGFQTGDETGKMSGLVDRMGGTGTMMATAAQGASAGKPTNKELLEGANRRVAEAEEEMGEVNELVNETDQNMRNTAGFGDEAEAMLEAEKLRDGEMKNLETAQKRQDNVNDRITAANAREEDLREHEADLTKKMEKLKGEEANLEGKAREDNLQQQRELEDGLKKNKIETDRAARTLKALNDRLPGLETEITRARESIQRHAVDVGNEFEKLVQRATIPIGTEGALATEGLRTVVLERHNAGVAQTEAGGVLGHTKHLQQQLAEEARRHPEAFEREGWYRWDGASTEHVPPPDGGVAKSPGGDGGGGGKSNYDQPDNNPDDDNPNDDQPDNQNEPDDDNKDNKKDGFPTE